MDGEHIRNHFGSSCDCLCLASVKTFVQKNDSHQKLQSEKVNHQKDMNSNISLYVVQNMKFWSFFKVVLQDTTSQEVSKTINISFGLLQNIKLTRFSIKVHVCKISFIAPA